MRSRIHPAIAVAVVLAALASCSLEDPGSKVDEAGCTSDDQCKAPRHCVIRFGHAMGTCEYPREAAGGSGGTGGGGGLD